MTDDSFERLMMRGLGLALLVLAWLSIVLIVVSIFFGLGECKA